MQLGRQLYSIVTVMQAELCRFVLIIIEVLYTF